MAKYRKLSRTSSQRKALLRGQVTALLNNGKIVTTEAKAKEVRKIAEGYFLMSLSAGFRCFQFVFRKLSHRLQRSDIALYFVVLLRYRAR